MSVLRLSSKAAQRGAASLVVVLLLFLVLSIVAAYTGRNLVFEQRTSVNQYRAAQAFEAAEAGVEWALALLNGGRIGPTCLESGATAANTSFRQRYLDIDADTGVITPRVTPAGGPLLPSCVSDGADWTCSCPNDSAPSLATPTGGAVFPAFRIRFSIDGVTRPGMVFIESQGCTRLDNDCLNFPAVSVASEGRALMRVLVALKPAIANPPAAALTVVGNIDPAATFRVFNTDAARGGLGLHAGNPPAVPGAPPPAVNLGAPRVVQGPPGSPSSATAVVGDPALTAMRAGADPLLQPDRLFPSVLGIWPQVYRDQPAAIELACPASGCASALRDSLALNPGRVHWIQGDLTLESAGDIGSLPAPANPGVAGPTLLVVTGRVAFTAAGVRLFGIVYSQDGNWSGNGEVQGAVVIDGDLGPSVDLTVALDGSVMDAMRHTHGSFVRVPGGWRDFD